MADRTTRPFSKFSRKYTFIILAVLSGIIGAIWVAIDTYTGSTLIIDASGEPNEYAFAIQSMTIGLIVSIIFVLILWLPVSRKPVDDLINKIKSRKNQNQQIIDPNSQPPVSAPQIKRKYSFIGQYIDPQYRGIRLPTPKMLLWLFLSGLF